MVPLLSLLLSLLLLLPSSLGDDKCRDPLAKCVIRAMGRLISNHVAWDDKETWVSTMKQFFTEDMIYDTNYSPDQYWGNTTGIENWFHSEHIPWNRAFDNATFSQMIFAAEESTATTTTYAKALWKGDLSTIPGSRRRGQEVTIRIYDFYQMRGNKISYNWMLLDMVQIMYYAGFRVLPKVSTLRPRPSPHVAGATAGRLGAGPRCHGWNPSPHLNAGGPKH